MRKRGFWCGLFISTALIRCPNQLGRKKYAVRDWLESEEKAGILFCPNEELREILVKTAHIWMTQRLVALYDAEMQGHNEFLQRAAGFWKNGFEIFTPSTARTEEPDSQIYRSVLSAHSQTIRKPSVISRGNDALRWPHPSSRRPPGYTTSQQAH